MGKAATDIYTFENVRNGGFVYVYKTLETSSSVRIVEGA